MQAVTNLDEDDTDVVAHREQQLLEVLGLCRCLLAEDAAADFRQSIDYLSHLGTEDVLDILGSIVGILNNVVQQGCTDTRRAEPHLLADNLCHGDGVHDIGLAREASYAFMCLACEVECLGDDVNFLSVA